jgi:hypothetical protein
MLQHRCGAGGNAGAAPGSQRRRRFGVEGLGAGAAALSWRRPRRVRQ